MTNEVGRNAPCPCESGKKYKQCCLRSRQLEAPAPPPVAKHPQPAPAPLVGSYNTGSEAMNEWDAFWNTFEAASIDVQLAMARDCILGEPNFDDEWAFTLFVEYLPDPVMEASRHEDWFDLFSLLAKRHPDIATTESGPIGSFAVTIALDAGTERTEEMTTALKLLFHTPAENVDHIASVLDHLAYHGVTAPLEYLLEGWTDIVDNPSLMRDTDWMWADWTATALKHPRPHRRLRRRAQEDPRPSARGRLTHFLAA